jgi:hypothetical protein
MPKKKKEEKAEEKAEEVAPSPPPKPPPKELGPVAAAQKAKKELLAKLVKDKVALKARVEELRIRHDRDPSPGTNYVAEECLQILETML